MGYTRVRTEVLLSNLIAAHGKESLYSYEELQEIMKCWGDMIPGYVTSDFSMKKIRDCIDEYPRLFCWVEHNGQICVGAGEKKPNVEFFNLGIAEHSILIKGLALDYPPANKREQTDIKLETEEGYEQFTRKRVA